MAHYVVSIGVSMGHHSRVAYYESVAVGREVGYMS